MKIKKNKKKYILFVSIVAVFLIISIVMAIITKKYLWYLSSGPCVGTGLALSLVLFTGDKE